LMFVFLSFVLFSYFVLISGQRTEMMLIEDAKTEMFDDMVSIGDLANEYYLSNTSTQPDVLQTLYLPWVDGGQVTTMMLEAGINYQIKITGIIIFSSGLQADPVFETSNNWQTHTNSNNFCNYNSLYFSDLPYSEAHSYSITKVGTGVAYTLRSNGCVAVSPDNIFTVEISIAGTSVEAYHTYDGFVPPSYLLNRPYTDVQIEFVSDSVIHFTGTSTLEPNVTYERKCTPSGSLQLIQ